MSSYSPFKFLSASWFQTPTEPQNQGPICYRITDIPPHWNESQMLSVLQHNDADFDKISTSNPNKVYQLGIFPTCSGSTQTVLLNLSIRTKFFDWIQKNSRKLLRSPDGDILVIDKAFFGLTPLNTPGNDAILELGHAFHEIHLIVTLTTVLWQ
jgi:hypothetical protein